VSTFAGHPLVMAATVANIEWLQEESAPERAVETGDYLGERLRELVDRHPSVAAAEGAGLLWAVELVKPDGSGERFVPLDRHAIPTGEQFWPSFFVAGECAKRGVALATAPPNTLRLGPSLAATREVVDRGIEALSGALSELDKRG
jgi:taurine---2-oxoglutarate transaminase